MDFFPSESISLTGSVSSPKAPVSASETAAPVPIIRDDRKPGDLTHLNLSVTQAMKDVQGLGVALGQLRTIAGELDERYRTLLQTCSAADQRSQDIESTFTRIDSLAQMRLGELSDAGDLAARTQKMLVRVESLSAETDKQLAAIVDARNLFGQDLAKARVEAKSRAIATAAETDRQVAAITDARNLFARDLADARAEAKSQAIAAAAETDRQLAAIAAARNLFGRDLAKARADAKSQTIAAAASPALLDRYSSHLERFRAAISAIHKTAPRPSRRAIVYAALAVLAVVAIAATWPDGSANGVGVPLVESRVLRGSALQLAELPETVGVEAPPSRPSVANPPVRASVAGFVGQLAIESSPPGAAVFIDGKPVGETPLSSVRVPAGSHAIWIDLPKYQRWTTAVTVRAGSVTRVGATLRAAPGGARK